MNFSLGEAVLGTGIDLSGLQDGFGRAEGVAKSGVGRLGGIISGGLGIVATAGAAVFAAGMAAVGAGIGIAINEAMGAQEVLAQTYAVIESTGSAAGMTAGEVADLAGALSLVTRFSDDTIQSGENLLLTFTNIGRDVFPDVTKIMLDMSTAMKQDVRASALQLGKALNNPAEGLTALTRVGVTFTAEQKKMVEQMVKAGDVAGAQRVILAELTKEFGGAAEAAGATFAGRLDILKNRLLNVAEAIGLSLLPVGEELLERFIEPALPKIERLGEGAAAFFTVLATGDIGGAFDTLGEFVNDVLPGAGPVLQGLGTDLEHLIVDVIPAIGTAASTAFQTVVDWVQVRVMPVLDRFRGWFETEIVPKAEAVRGWFEQNWPTVQAKFDEALEAANRLKAWFDTEALKAIGTFVTNATEKLAGIRDVLSDYVLAKANELESWFLRSGLTAIDTFVTNAKVKLDALREWIEEDGIPAVRDFVDSFHLEDLQPINFDDLLGSSLSNLSTLIENITTRLPAVGTVLEALNTAATVVSTAFDLAVQSVEGALTTLSPLIEHLSGDIGRAKGEFVDFGIVWQTLGGIISGFLTLTVASIVIGIGLIAAVIAGVVTAIQAALPWAQAFMTGFANSFALTFQVIANFWNMVVALFTGRFGELQGLVQTFWGSVEALFTNGLNTIAALMGTVFSGIIGLVSGFVTTVVSLFRGLFDILVGNSIVPELMTAMFTVVSSGMGKIATLIGDQITKWIALFEGNVAAFVGAGANLLEGLKAGIASKLEEVLKFIRETAERIITTFTDATRMHSPSLVFAGIGENLMAGLEVGIERGAHLPEGALASLADRLGSDLMQASFELAPAAAGPITDNRSVNFTGPISDGIDIEYLAWRVAEIFKEHSHE